MAALRLLACLACVAPGHVSAKTWAAGGLSFSDELGGARLVSVSGTGSRDDPIVLVEEITGAGPAVLVVRDHRSRELNISPALGFLSLAVVKVIANRGPWAWSGFDLELRRTPEQPSVYTTGSRSTSRRTSQESPRPTA
jgi:hypothetical protein